MVKSHALGKDDIVRATAGRAKTRKSRFMLALELSSILISTFEMVRVCCCGGAVCGPESCPCLAGFSDTLNTTLALSFVEVR